MDKIDKVYAFLDPLASCLLTLANHVSRDKGALVVIVQGGTTKGLSIKFCVLDFSSVGTKQECLQARIRVRQKGRNGGQIKAWTLQGHGKA